MLAAAGTTRQLFPAPEIIDRKVPLFIVEGEADAVSLWSMGFRAVAVPGANGWRPEWAARLWKFKRVIVLCDCDRPGRQLAERLGEMPNTRVVDLEPGCDTGYDVGDMIREAAAEGGLWQARRVLEGIAA
jgi:DNA primase